MHIHTIRITGNETWQSVQIVERMLKKLKKHGRWQADQIRQVNEPNSQSAYTNVVTKPSAKF